MENAIKRTLQDAFAPQTLEVINESHLHAGHAGHIEAGGGDATHFRVRIVSGAFNDKSRVESHRMIYEALDEYIKQGVHALAIEVRGV